VSDDLPPWSQASVEDRFIIVADVLRHEMWFVLGVLFVAELLARWVPGFPRPGLLYALFWALAGLSITLVLAGFLLRGRADRRRQLAADLSATIDDSCAAGWLFEFAVSEHDPTPPTEPESTFFLRQFDIAVTNQARPLARLCWLRVPRARAWSYLARLRAVAGRQSPSWWGSGDRRAELVALAKAIHSDGPASISTDEAHLRIAGELLVLAAARLEALSPRLPRSSQRELAMAQRALLTMSGRSYDAAEILHSDPPPPKPTAERPLFPDFY
jgi:hypothetical protein